MFRVLSTFSFYFLEEEEEEKDAERRKHSYVPTLCMYVSSIASYVSFQKKHERWLQTWWDKTAHKHTLFDCLTFSSTNVLYNVLLSCF